MAVVTPPLPQTLAFAWKSPVRPFLVSPLSFMKLGLGDDNPLGYNILAVQISSIFQAQGMIARSNELTSKEVIISITVSAVHCNKY